MEIFLYYFHFRLQNFIGDLKKDSDSPPLPDAKDTKLKQGFELVILR